MAKIIHTNDKIKLSKIDMATLHAIAEREGLEEIPDYTIFAINPQLYDEALKKHTDSLIEQIPQFEEEKKRFLAERQRAS